MTGGFDRLRRLLLGLSLIDGEIGHLEHSMLPGYTYIRVVGVRKSYAVSASGSLRMRRYGVLVTTVPDSQDPDIG